jgi:hypothetical protein
MAHSDGYLTRRRLLLSGLTACGWLSLLGSVAVLSGCGDDKSEGQVKAVDVTKTQDGMDSMKAYQGQMQTKVKARNR